MIIESVMVALFALALDLAVGDPRNRFHPTAWIGRLIGGMIPHGRSESPRAERAAGVIIVLAVTGAVLSGLLALDLGIAVITIDWIALTVSVLAGIILLKTTIAVRGMELHATSVAAHIAGGRIESARESLAMIVKRDTANLDRDHVISGVLESVSENTVDGITGPLFYFGLFGIFGAFAYRIINTFDSMIGYRTQMFGNLGWFAANCDSIMNYVPSRLTALLMVLGCMILGIDWRGSYRVMLRDGSVPESSNAGYPIAVLAGALNTTLEKIDCHRIGDGKSRPEIPHIGAAIRLMKVTSVLFCCMVTIPMVVGLSYIGWWFHA